MPSASDTSDRPWNLGRLIGPKPPLKSEHIWAIRTRPQHEGRTRDLACSTPPSTARRLAGPPPSNGPKQLAKRRQLGRSCGRCGPVTGCFPAAAGRAST